MLDSTFRAERAKTRQANIASHMEIATRIASVEYTEVRNFIK